MKLEGIAVLFDPMMKMAQFPIQIYPRRLWTFLTVGIPVAFLTTYPTQALLKTVQWPIIGASFVLAAVFLLFSHFFFQFALRFYGSASS